MVCIAAFIILIVIGIFVAFLSIFNRELGRKYLKILKKSWHCFSRHVTFRKCDTNFADDVKTVLLKKVVIKKPTWVKPLSTAIEVASILIVIVTIWSVVEGVKAGLALWTLGTCNVSQPANCMLGADSCALDEEGLNWFEEWGEIFGSIPDRLKNWQPSDYDLAPAFYSGKDTENGSFKTTSSDSQSSDTSGKIPSSVTALSIVDPGCSVCMQSYKNMKSSNFLDSHTLAVVVYPITNSDGSTRFKNSELIARYIYAAGNELGSKILDRIFTEYNDEYVNFQSVMNSANPEEAEKLLKEWLTEWKADVSRIEKLAHSDEIAKILADNKKVVDEQIKPKGIPTFIYDGGKHLGLFK